MMFQLSMVQFCWLVLLLQLWCTSPLPVPLPQVSPSFRTAQDKEFCHNEGTRRRKYDPKLSSSVLRDVLPDDVSLQRRSVSFLQKLERQQDIHVLVMGGSFTKGAGVMSGPARRMVSWPGRFFSWLRAAFPSNKFHLHNEAEGSTTTFYAFHRLQQLRHPVDVLVMDYAINDNIEETIDEGKLLHITETFIRYVYDRFRDALLVYHSTNVLVPYNVNAEKIYRQVCGAYGVPLLSYTRGVQKDLFACKSRNVSLQYSDDENCVLDTRPDGTPFFRFMLWDGQVHPVEETHRIVARTMNHYFIQLVTLYNTTLDAHGLMTDVTRKEIKMPEFPMFKMSNSDQLLEGGCSHPMLQLSSLHSDEESNLTSVRENFSPMVADGWSFRRDKPGKPLGWIAETNIQNPLLSTNDTNILSFIVVTVTGSVCIMYLSSYENSGIFEVYMGIHEYSANGGIEKRKKTMKDTLCCCNRSHSVQYPNIAQAGISDSKYIDTLHTQQRRVSEVKVQSFRTAYHGGYFLLNIQHLPLSNDERVKRGGDKVKILGISTC